MLVLVGCLAATVVLGQRAAGLRRSDDILAFLPQGSPEVRAFFALDEIFGATQVAFVGVAAADVYAPTFLARLERLTRALDDLPGLDTVLSLANVTAYRADPMGGVITEPVLALPGDPRANVLARPHLVGNLVSAAGDAVMLYAYLAPGQDPTATAAAISATVEGVFPAEQVYYGGAPFIGSYVYHATARDLAELLPWAALVVVLVALVGFGDLWGGLLALGAAAVAVMWTLGLMALAGEPLSLVLSSAPVVLVAVGSTYGLHVLSALHRLAAEGPRALERAVETSAPTLTVAALTTAASLAAFLVMDIAPLRRFGLFAAVGVLACLVACLCVVPAVLACWPWSLRPHAHHQLARWVGRWLSPRHPRRLAAVLAVVTAGLGWGATSLDSSVDLTQLFNEGSPPHRGMQFLARHFGGADVVQVLATGDIGHPATLRRLQWLADRAASLDGVGDVQHVGQAVQQVNGAMNGVARIPDRQDQARLSLSLLAAEPATKILVDSAAEHALVHVELAAGADVPRTLAILEREAAEVAQAAWTQDTADAQTAAHVTFLATRHGFTWTRPPSGGALRRAVDSLSVSPAAVAPLLERFLASSENPVPVEEGGQTPKGVARALTQVGPLATAAQLEQVLAQASGLPTAHPWVADLARAALAPLHDAWRGARAHALAAQWLQPTPSPSSPVVAALWSLDAPVAPQAPPLQLEVSGLPVMHRGLARSVARNQWLSAGVALVAVVLILAAAFGSLALGSLGALPTAVTLAWLYGLMGYAGIRLDIGTSMLASFITGIGVDYAVHLLAAWRSTGSVTATAARCGPAIVVSAAMLAMGFGVLVLGEARPLQNVGALLAVSMVGAAFATLAIMAVWLAGRE